MGEPASESAQQFIELVRSKITAEEFGDFLVDLRNLHKYSSAGDLETAERFLDGIADFFTTDEEYMHLMSQFGAFVPVDPHYPAVRIQWILDDVQPAAPRSRPR